MSEWNGQIVSFYPTPDAVEHCMPRSGARRFAGEVVGTFAVEPHGPGKIPDLGLLVRGRTGRKLKITLCTHYVALHKSYPEAEASN